MIYSYDTEAIFAETTGLTLLEQGIYRVLLDHYVERNGLAIPDPDGALTQGANLYHLAGLIGATGEVELLVTAKIIMSFFFREGAMLHHPRLRHLISEPTTKRTGQLICDLDVLANSTEDRPLAIPFGSSDNIFWWEPPEEEIHSLAQEFRLCNIRAEIEQARQSAMLPTVRPRTDPITFLKKRIANSNKLIQEKLVTSGVTPLSQESARFVEFVGAYPRQTDLQAAWSVWSVLPMDDDEEIFKLLMLGLKRWKLCKAWEKRDSEVIPTAAQFLNSRLWEVVPKLNTDTATRVMTTTVSFQGQAATKVES